MGAKLQISLHYWILTRFHQGFLNPLDFNRDLTNLSDYFSSINSYGKLFLKLCEIVNSAPLNSTTEVTLKDVIRTIETAIILLIL